MQQSLVSDWITRTATSIFASYTLVCKQVNNGAICSIDSVWEWGRNLQCMVLNLLWVLPFIHMSIQPLSIYGEPTPCWALSFSPLQSTPAEREREWSGEPSKSLYHSSGVQLVRLSGFRFCLLLLPVCASVSSSVQWEDDGITVRITRVHVYIKY